MGISPTLPVEAPETAIVQPLMPAIAADTLQNADTLPATPASDKPKAHARDWVGRRLLGHKSGSVSWRAAYNAHVAEAETDDMMPESENMSAGRSPSTSASRSGAAASAN